MLSRHSRGSGNPLSFELWSGLFGASMRLTLRAPVGREKSLPAILYSGLPALHPFGAALRAFKFAPGEFVEQRVRIKSSLSAMHNNGPRRLVKSIPVKPVI